MEGDQLRRDACNQRLRPPGKRCDGSGSPRRPEEWRHHKPVGFAGELFLTRSYCPMSPSRPFILRPVATSLLMVAMFLAGAVAFFQLPISALPEVDYPTIVVQTFYPGASPDVVASAVTASARAPVRRSCRPEPDDVDQFRWVVDHRHAVPAFAEYRRGRAGSAGGHQRRARATCRRTCRLRRCTRSRTRPMRRC